MHLFWRLSRGQSLGVQVMAFDAADRILLVEPVSSKGWSLPGAMVRSGETVREALARALAAAGAPASGPARLHGLYRGASDAEPDQIALFVVRTAGAAPGPAEPSGRGGAFFAPDALPPQTAADARRRIAEVQGAARPPPAG